VELKFLGLKEVVGIVGNLLEIDGLPISCFCVNFVFTCFSNKFCDHFFALEATWESRNPDKVTQNEVMIEEGEICSEAFGRQFIQ